MDAQVHIPVSGPLQDSASAIWQVSGNNNSRETILPKGIVEIIFNFSTGAKVKFQNGFVSVPRCFVQGLNTNTFNVEYSGRQHLLGIRLNREKIQDLLGLVPGELNNRMLDLELVSPDFRSLWHQLGELTSFDDRVNLLQRFLPLVSSESCQRSVHLNRLFQEENVEMFSSVDSLAREICYSTRQLNRITHHLFGLSPEELIGYKKFLRAVHLICHQNKSLTSIAYESGYYDQAHFCRSFKSYAGMTAMQYKKQKSQLPFHIFS